METYFSGSGGGSGVGGSFNFLASLINGNTKDCPTFAKDDVFLLTS